MTYDPQYWLRLAGVHVDRLVALEDGLISRSELWNPTMTLAQAAEVEQRNIAYCLRQAAAATQEMN